MRPIAFLFVGAVFLALGFTAAGSARGDAREVEPASSLQLVADEASPDGVSDMGDEGAETALASAASAAPVAGDTVDTSDASGASGASIAGASVPPSGDDRVRDDEDDDDDGRRRWRSRRNRYPAPDFTPAEWQPPEGPVRIALQAGHWRAHEAPDELDGLKTGGTHAVGLAEWEVNLALAERTGEMLRELGYEVDILPAVVPPDYHAHLFIAIHADGAIDTAARGFRIAAPGRDYTGRAQQMVDLLEETYQRETGLRKLPDVTRRMRNYYAFNVRRYEHSLDPRTIALILETGFLTSPTDREVIVNDPDRVARGIVEAVKAFPVTALVQAPAPASTEGPEPTTGATRGEGR